MKGGFYLVREGKHEEISGHIPGIDAPDIHRK